LVGEDDDASVEGVSAHEFQNGLLDAVAEKPLPAPQHDGEDHQPVLVDEAEAHQLVHETAAAEDRDVPTGLSLLLGYLLGDVPLYQGRVVLPEGFLSSAGIRKGMARRVQIFLSRYGACPQRRSRVDVGKGATPGRSLPLPFARTAAPTPWPKGPQRADLPVQGCRPLGCLLR